MELLEELQAALDLVLTALASHDALATVPLLQQAQTNLSFARASCGSELDAVIAGLVEEVTCNLVETIEQRLQSLRSPMEAHDMPSSHDMTSDSRYWSAQQQQQQQQQQDHARQQGPCTAAAQVEALYAFHKHVTGSLDDVAGLE
jgi:hypothetical protein